MENKGTNGKVQRGEIYLYDFGNNGGSIQNGVRPALVVQCDEGNSTTFSMSGMRLRQAKKSVRFGRIKRQTVSVSVPPSHLDMSETHRTRRTGW